MSKATGKTPDMRPAIAFDSLNELETIKTALIAYKNEHVHFDVAESSILKLITTVEDCMKLFKEKGK